MNRLPMRSLSLFALLPFALPTSAQSVHYVDVAANGPGTGTSTDPFPTIQAALTSPSIHDGDTVVVRPGTYEELVDFSGKSVHLTSESGPANTTIDASLQLALDQSAVMVHSGEGPGTRLTGFTLYGGLGSQIFEPFYGIPTYGGGGLLVLDGEIDVRDCVFTKNHTVAGGAVYADGSRLSLTDCVFDDNSSSLFGGALQAHESNVLIRRSLFRTNEAQSQDGGAINVFGGDLIVESSRFESSRALLGGNGAHLAMRNGARVSLNEVTLIDGFVLDGNGGGIYAEGSRLTVNACSFEDNRSGDLASNHDGGAIYLRAGSLAVRRSHFERNRSGRGGAIYLQDAESSIEASTFTSNEAEAGLQYLAAEGGALSCHDTALVVRDSSFVQNTVTSNGPYVTGNTAQGGALWCDAPIVRIFDSTFLGNRAVYLSGSDLFLQRQRPGATGAAVHGPARAVRSLFLGNEASSDPSRINIWVEGGALYGVRLAQDCVLRDNGVFGTRPGFDLGPAANHARLACCELAGNLPAKLPALGPSTTLQACAAASPTRR